MSSDLTTGYFTGTNADVIHLYRDCRALGNANRIARTNPQLHPHRGLCTYCRERANEKRQQRTVGGGRTCRECGGELNGPDDACPFCDRCDALGIVNGRHANHRQRRREQAD